MKSFSKRVVAVGVIGFSMLFIVVLFMYLSAAHESAELLEGAESGYPLAGTYSNSSDSELDEHVASFAIFDADDDDAGDSSKTWQLSLDEKYAASGVYEETVDPNVYVLLDYKDGNVLGSLHLAYASNRGEGKAYLTIDGEDYVLEKISVTPFAVGGFH